MQAEILYETVRADDKTVYASVVVKGVEEFGIEFNCSTSLVYETGNKKGQKKDNAALVLNLLADAKQQLDLQTPKTVPLELGNHA